MEDSFDGMLSQKVIFDYVAGPGPLDAYEIDILRSIVNNEQELFRGDVGNSSNENNSNIRRSDIAWLDMRVSEKYGQNDIVPKLSNTLDSINAANFSYDLLTFTVPQITKYKSSEKGFYNWHTDCSSVNSPICRKLSWIIQLSDPTEYEGGRIGMVFADGNQHYLDDANPKILEKGTIIVFPSFMPHTITPVTEGTRYSLVGWCEGPRFR